MILILRNIISWFGSILDLITSLTIPTGINNGSIHLVTIFIFLFVLKWAIKFINMFVLNKGSYNGKD